MLCACSSDQQYPLSPATLECSLAGVGALPYGVKWLLNGEVSAYIATTYEIRSLGAASDFTTSNPSMHLLPAAPGSPRPL